jgi:hypothetical protein
MNADEGFCRGACLDWVRRVLQGRLAYGYERTGNEKGGKREARMREIQATLTGRVIPELKAMEAELEQESAALAARVPAINAMEGDAQQAAIDRYTADQTQLNAAKRAYGDRADMGSVAASWPRVAGQLDARAAQARGKGGTTPKRSFTNLTPVAGSDKQSLQTSARLVAAIGKVMREMAPSTAAVFVFKPASEVGHVIGVFRTTRSTAIFDPAYGMYGGVDVEPAISGVAYLIETVYPGSNSLEFTVFERKKA